MRVSLDPLGAWPSHGCQTMRKSSMGAAPVMVWQMAARVCGGGEAVLVGGGHNPSARAEVLCVVLVSVYV